MTIFGIISHISQTHLDILINFQIFYTLESDGRLKAEIAKIPKFAFFGVGLF